MRHLLLAIALLAASACSSLPEPYYGAVDALTVEMAENLDRATAPGETVTEAELLAAYESVHAALCAMRWAADQAPGWGGFAGAVLFEMSLISRETAAEWSGPVPEPPEGVCG